MQTKEYTTLDRSRWGSGPWDNESDKIQFPDPKTGLPCLIVRQEGGHLCGYVGVTEGHPAFGVNYNSVDGDISVHGGLTFSDKCQPDSEHDGICHVPGDGESDNVWWFGFDCIHGGDLSPSMRRFNGGGVYRTVEYVKANCAELAEQLAAMKV